MPQQDLFEVALGQSKPICLEAMNNHGTKMTEGLRGLDLFNGLRIHDQAGEITV